MKKILISITVVLALVSCSSGKALYTWYNSSNAYYNYTKRQDDKSYQKLKAEYEKVLTQQKGTRKTVPPGINAEYGYMLYKEGKTEEGKQYLNREMELYPESKPYISSILKQMEQ